MVLTLSELSKLNSSWSGEYSKVFELEIFIFILPSHQYFWNNFIISSCFIFCIFVLFINIFLNSNFIEIYVLVKK